MAPNKSLTSQQPQEATLRKQANYLRKNKNLQVTIEGHADERGTREYNSSSWLKEELTSARDYLMTHGMSGKSNFS